MTREERIEALYWHLNEMVGDIDHVNAEARELGLATDPVISGAFTALEVSCWAVLTHLGTLREQPDPPA